MVRRPRRVSSGSGQDQVDLERSFLAERTAIGVLGIALPVALGAFGVLSHDWQGAISDYDYTPASVVFVGILTAIGVFLLAYTGYTRKRGEVLSDKWMSRLAGAAIVTVVAVPDRSPFAWAHFAAAAVFFATLGLISLRIFTRHDGAVDRVDPAKRRRNVAYRVCGGLILADLPVMWLLKDTGALYWGEAAACLLFGIAWLTKGRALELLLPRPRASPAAEAAEAADPAIG